MTYYTEDEWGRKGATMSDKSARTEFGLTQQEIIAALRAGTMHYREASMHGNPWYRLLRREVEELVRTTHGERYLRDRKAQTELAGVNREIRQLRSQLAALEKQRAALTADLAESSESAAAP